MTLTTETYDWLDKSKKYLPTLEIRFLNDKCMLYSEGVSIFDCEGEDKFINNDIQAVLYGITLGAGSKSLKKTLRSL